MGGNYRVVIVATIIAKICVLQLPDLHNEVVARAFSQLILASISYLAFSLSDLVVLSVKSECFSLWGQIFQTNHALMKVHVV